MAALSVRDQIIAELNRLNPDQQRRVLAFTRELGRERQGVTLAQIKHHIGMIPADDLQRMAQAIEDACEQVDRETWNIDLPDG
jgi:hypothetical protein